MAPEDPGQPSTAADFKAVTRKEVTLPKGGQRVVIRVLSGMDFMEMGELPLIGVKEAAADHVQRVAKDPKAQLRQFIEIAARGTVQPRISTKLPQDCGPDEVSAYEIVDLDWLAIEILRYSGLTEEVAASAAKFPEGPGSGGS